MRHESSTGPTDSGDPRPATDPGPATPSDGIRADTPFSWETLTLLRSIGVAVAEHWVHDGLIAAARVIAEDVHRAELPFERALIALKQVWSGLAEVCRLPLTDAQAVLAAVVTASIKAYFVGPGPPAPVPPGDEARERADSVARTLLGVIAACVPETLDTHGDAPTLSETLRTRPTGRSSAAWCARLPACRTKRSPR